MNHTSQKRDSPRARTVLILDLHGVVLTATPDGHAEFLRGLGLTQPEWKRIHQTFLAEECAWDRVERGELSLADFAQELSRRVRSAGGSCSPEHASTIWGSPDPFAKSKLNTSLIQFVSVQPEPPRLFIATNNIKEWRSRWEEKIFGLRQVEHIFDSSEIGSRKPEADFFAHIESYVGSNPREYVFVDDRIQCVNGALRRKWNAILFQSSEQTIEELASFVI